jgi:hypothetical protein
MRGPKPERRRPEPQFSSEASASRIGKRFRVCAIVLVVAVATIAVRLHSGHPAVVRPRGPGIHPVSSASRQGVLGIAAAAASMGSSAIGHGVGGLGCAFASVSLAAALCPRRAYIASSGPNSEKTSTVARVVFAATAQGCAVDETACQLPEQAPRSQSAAPIATTSGSAPAVSPDECGQTEPDEIATAIVAGPVLSNSSLNWHIPTCASSRSILPERAARLASSPRDSSAGSLRTLVDMSSVPGASSRAATLTLVFKPSPGPISVLSSGGTEAPPPAASPATTPSPNIPPQPQEKPAIPTPSPYTQPYETPPR